MDLPTYTNIWRIEKRLYKLYDLRLPMPLPLVQIGVFIGVFVPWIVLLRIVGIPFHAPWHVFYIVPPLALTWMATRPVIEGKRLTELLLSQTRYLVEPRTWCRLTPIREPREVVVTVKVWRRAGAAVSAGAGAPGALAGEAAAVGEAALAAGPEVTKAAGRADRRAKKSRKARRAEQAAAGAQGKAAARTAASALALRPARSALPPQSLAERLEAQDAARLERFEPQDAGGGEVHLSESVQAALAARHAVPPAETAPVFRFAPEAVPVSEPEAVPDEFEYSPDPVIPASEAVAPADAGDGTAGWRSMAKWPPPAPKGRTESGLAGREAGVGKPALPVEPPPATPTLESASPDLRVPVREQAGEGSGKRGLASGVRRPGGAAEFWKAITPPDGSVVSGKSEEGVGEGHARQAGVERGAEPEQVATEGTSQAVTGETPAGAAEAGERPRAVRDTVPDIPVVAPPKPTRPDIPMVPGAFGGAERGAAPKPPAEASQGPESEEAPAREVPAREAPLPPPVDLSDLGEPLREIRDALVWPPPGQPRQMPNRAAATPSQPGEQAIRPEGEPALPGAERRAEQPVGPRAEGDLGQQVPMRTEEQSGRSADERGLVPSAGQVPPGAEGPGARHVEADGASRSEGQGVRPTGGQAEESPLPAAEELGVRPVGRQGARPEGESGLPAAEGQGVRPEGESGVPGTEEPGVRPGAEAGRPGAVPPVRPIANPKPWPPQPLTGPRAVPPRPQGTPYKVPPPAPVPDEQSRPADAERPAVPAARQETYEFGIPEVPGAPVRSGPASPVRPRPRPLTPPEPPPPPQSTITPPDVEQEGTAGGLRRLIQAVGGGGGQVDAEYEERLQRPFQGTRRIVVLGCTGGAGQTVTGLMLGHTFAQYCGEPVVAVDVNPGTGSLSRRTRSETPETLTGLIARSDQVHSLTAMRRYTSSSKSGLDVIAAGRNPLQALDDRDYALAIRTLDRFYSIMLLDAAAAIVARVLGHADQIVLVAPASADAPRAVGMTFEWLDGHGYDELRSRAVTVINGVSRRSLEDVEQAEAVARGRCRALVRIPWDDHLSLDRAPRNELKSLRAPTRRAYLALAGVVAGGFAALPERYQQEQDQTWEQEVGR